jgi:hypothetical protein
MDELSPRQLRALARNLWGQGQTLTQIAAVVGAADEGAVARLLVSFQRVPAPDAGEGVRGQQRQRRALLAALAGALRAEQPGRDQIPAIAARLGVSVRTVNDYLWDPDGSKRRAIKDRTVPRGICRTCGRPTSYSGRNRISDYCSEHREDGKPRRMTRAKATHQVREFTQRTGIVLTTTDLESYERRRDPRRSRLVAEAELPTARQLRRLWGSARTALDDIYADGIGTAHPTPE